MVRDKHLTMKDLPDSEKPYEKSLQYGVNTLSDAELLAVILRTGSHKIKAVDLAHQLLLLDSEQPGLMGLIQRTPEELRTVKGIGEVKSIQIGAIFELAKRIAKLNAIEKLKINSPSSVAAMYMSEMRYLKQEQFRLICLDTKNQIIADKIMTIGSVNASIVHPREIFIEAIRHGAVNLIMVHNHPSGDPTPSREDRLITKRVVECGELLGIKVLDHIIIGDGRYISLKEKGIC
ncbi:RadC family protein [Vallitalea okinawensis]|uniref:RadC family protein n=1 Tax=Vallitalea okinawensis TaxID=2078660 RepID=UPI000CFC69C4|nr:DNA repair protein RadC [Vallitalea okinawensis]